jgi:hypothetical protein
MSDKKLLTESEIRRFMTLANIPSLGGKATLSEMAAPAMSAPEVKKEEAVYQEEAPTMEAEEEMEVGDLGAEEAPAAGGKEAEFEALVKKLAELVGVDVEVEAGEEEPEMEAGEEGEEGGEEGEEEEEMEEAYGGKEGEEMEEMYHKKELSESKLVDAVLARVTARLVAEAKKKKKMTPAEKMKAMKAAKAAKEKDKKKKLDEANAVAPKETKPSKEAPEGHGPGKTEHGVHKGDSKDQAWGSEKGGHEMKKVSAEAPHSTKKGTNLATLGGHKKVK